jgi:predicted Zn-dependent peptidase
VIVVDATVTAAIAADGIATAVDAAEAAEVVAARAGSALPVNPTDVIATKFERTKLDSGLTVVTEAMTEVRSVTVGYWFDVGSRHEPDDIAGTSHFLEHLLFKGTPTRSARQIAESFDRVGGDINAFTSKEYTCYYSRVLDTDLSMALDVLSDMLINSIIDPTEFESERRVILEEIAMHEDAPDELVHDLFYREIWRGHPLGRPVLGFNESIGGVARDAVAEYWRSMYSPANLVVAAAGNLNHAELVSQVETLCRDLGGTKTERGTAPPKPLGGVGVLKRPTEQAHIVLGTEGLQRGHEDRHALAVLDTVLGGGMSSRLFQEIREKRGLAYSVYSYRAMFADSGTFSIYAGTTPQNAETVIDLIREQVASLVDDGITEEELQRAKGHVKGALVLSSEDPVSRMNRVGKQQLTTGEILSIDELIERFDRLEMADIQRVTQRVLGSGDFRVQIVGPFEEDAFDRYAA